MMKRMIALVLGVIFLFSMSTVAFAAENETEEVNNTGARATSTDLNKTEDFCAVRTHLYGISNVNGKTPIATTTFTFKSYGSLSAAEITTIQNAYKKVGAGAMTSALDGDVSYSAYAYRTGTSGSYSESGSARSFAITMMTGNHYVSYSDGTLSDIIQGSSLYYAY